MYTTAIRHVTVKLSNCSMFAEWHGTGAYDFDRDMLLYRINRGPFRGRYLLGDHGFRWRDNYGSYRREYSVLKDTVDADRLADLISDGNLCAAQEYYFEGYVPVVVHVTD